MNIDLRQPGGLELFKALASGKPSPVSPLPSAPTAEARKPASVVSTNLPTRILIEFDVACRAASEANVRGKARAEIGRKKLLKAATRAAIPSGLVMPLPVVVTLIRLGGKQLDEGENLPRSLKAPKDVIAAWLGVADTGRDSRVKWRFKQAPAFVAGVRIRIVHRGSELQ